MSSRRGVTVWATLVSASEVRRAGGVGCGPCGAAVAVAGCEVGVTAVGPTRVGTVVGVRVGGAGVTVGGALVGLRVGSEVAVGSGVDVAVGVGVLVGNGVHDGSAVGVTVGRGAARAAPLKRQKPTA